MYRFFKNIVNTLIIFLAVIGLISIYKNHSLDGIFDGFSNAFSFDKEKTIEQVGDFSQVDKEFEIDKAINVMGYKTVVAKHQSSGQKMIIVDSGKKTVLTQDDLTDENIKAKLEGFCQKCSNGSTEIESVKIIERGYMNTYGQRVPYVKIDVKLTKLPSSNFVGIISVVEDDNNNKRIVISMNDKNRYSHLITTEFYKNIKDSKF